jgi:hypothetical protein
MSTNRDPQLALLGLLLAGALLGQAHACQKEGTTPEGTPPAREEVTETAMTIQEAKDAWEAKLLAIPGVTGVAIGLTRDRQAKCIKVYLDRDRGEIAEEIPQTIEGHPVEVETRGTFRAQ